MTRSKSPLPDTWILLDSCSTVNIISTEQLLHDIHTVTPLQVHCNAGAITLSQKGTFGTFPETVWYNPDGMANILSLASVKKHYRVTMDTDVEDCLQVHSPDGTCTTTFEPSTNGVYHHRLLSEEHPMVFVTTVQQRKEGYTNRDIRRAKQARRLQNILMHPNTRDLGDNIIRYLKNCDVTPGDLKAAEDIYGPNLASLQGKTVRRATTIGRGHTEPVPERVYATHKHCDLSTDIMFVNKIPFLATLSRGIRFGTVSALPNRQTSTIVNRLKQVVRIYRHRGFKIRAIFADSEFEPIRPSFPFLDTASADDHVADIERYIRTVKDRTRSAWHSMPFTYVPRVMVVRLVENAVFWLNSFPAGNGASTEHSPRYIITGTMMDHKLHARLQFGEYVQTHEEHTNDMQARTMGCICLGPTGNSNGSHHFMSLLTGKRITRTRWTLLPMPAEVIHLVNQMGKSQGMPRTVTFANRTGNEIEDRIQDLSQWSDTDDESYEPDSDSDDSDSDDSHSESADGDSDSHDSDPDDDDASEYDDEHINPSGASSSDSSVASSDASSESGSWPDHDEPETIGPSIEEHSDTPTTTSGYEPPPQQSPHSGHDADSDVESDSVETTGVEPDDTSVSDDDEDEDDDEPTESDQYADAEARGRAAAAGHPLPKREKRTRHDPVYEYIHVMFGNMAPNVLLTLLDDVSMEDHMSLLTAQMSAKAGLKQFGQAGADAIVQELEQLIYRKVMEAKKADALTHEQKRAALRYLMFLKMKRCGRIKGRGCADGRKQRVYKSKEETSSPTIATESLFISCIIDAMEHRDVATVDIPGAFMQADMDELVHLKIEGELAELLVRVDPKYREMITYENGKAVIYAELKKALYGTLQAALLFWKELSTFLSERGFIANPYDPCVMNKTIGGRQCTIGWHVDDLKISHEDSAVVDDVIVELEARFGREAPLSVTRGTNHEYLGMQIDFSQVGKVVLSMEPYIEQIFVDCPTGLGKGPASTPAAAHLFEVDPEAGKLAPETKETFHHLVAQLLYLSKRARPDIQTAVSFLCTRVQCPDVDDYKKLNRCLAYLRRTKDMPLTLEASSMGTIRWWIDASFGVHPNMRSHTGATMSFGKGSPINLSTKQKINTRSSTEAELVGVNDAMGLILWTRKFIEAQGYTVNDNVVFQDNQSTMRLQNNGRRSSSKKTRHIDIRYYFITDNIRRKELRVVHCPTDQMRGDFFTKPLQGSLFRHHVSAIMNLPVNYFARKRGTTVTVVEPQECVGGSDSENCLDQSTSLTSTVCPSSASDTVPSAPVTS